MNLKKHISVVLAIYLLVFSSGVSLDIHFCCGKIADISLFNKERCVEVSRAVEKKSCCSAKSSKKNKCCSYYNVQAELTDVVFGKTNFNVDLSYLLPTVETIAHQQTLINRNSKILDYSCATHAPPFYLLYSKLLFYA